jgi:hypothetical protein
MKRYYGFNVYSQPNCWEAALYHQNPVVRGLVERPEQWEWSSFRAYACRETGIVKVNDWSWWEKKLASGVSRWWGKSPLLATGQKWGTGP